MDERSLYVCHGRIKGDYLIFILRSSLLAEKLVEKAHCETLHWGVALTMAKIRLQFWIPIDVTFARKLGQHHFDDQLP